MRGTVSGDTRDGIRSKLLVWVTACALLLRAALSGRLWVCQFGTSVCRSAHSLRLLVLGARHGMSSGGLSIGKTGMWPV